MQFSTETLALLLYRQRNGASRRVLKRTLLNGGGTGSAAELDLVLNSDDYKSAEVQAHARWLERRDRDIAGEESSMCIQIRSDIVSAINEQLVSHGELSNRTGIPINRLRGILNGTEEVLLWEIAKLAHALGKQISFADE